MKTAVFSLLAALSLFSALADGEIAASVTLRDSSVIKGTVAEATALEGGVVFADDVKIPLPLVRELAADGTNGAQIICYIDDPQVVHLAEQRHVTRAEVGVDMGLALQGPKLLVIGSAPAALNRIIHRRQREPMSDVCVLAAPTGFASVVQLKERLMDSDLTSIIVRGKKGGIPVTVALMNAILREISENPGT